MSNWEIFALYIVIFFFADSFDFCYYLSQQPAESQ